MQAGPARPLHPSWHTTEPVLLSPAWPTSCTSPPPATATVQGATSSWRAPGAAYPAMSPCLAAPVSVQPLSTWWVTCCRVSVSLWLPPSSTSRCLGWTPLRCPREQLPQPHAGCCGALRPWHPHTWVPSLALPPPALHRPGSLQPQCKIADPISTLFFSVFVLGSTFTILRDVFRVLMEGEQGGCRARGAGGWRGAGAPQGHGCHSPFPMWQLTPSQPLLPTQAQPSPPLCPSLAPLSPPIPFSPL